jgi:hypothetical protein
VPDTFLTPKPTIKPIPMVPFSAKNYQLKQISGTFVFVYTTNLAEMATNIEKVTLSLDRALLVQLAKRAKKNLSTYVRDLVEREALKNNEEFEISKDILELKGLLKSDEQTTKTRVRKSAIGKMRNYER